MKVLCINGSPKATGSTARIIEKIAEGIHSVEPSTVSTYVLNKLNIGYCQGCRECSYLGRCVQNDDMVPIISDLLTSDFVVVGSPSYWGDITGQLKVFIDRCLPLCEVSEGRTVVPAGKFGISVAVRTGRSKEENEHIVGTIEHFFGHLGITPITSYMVQQVESPRDLDNKPEILDEAYALGRCAAHRLPA